MDNDKNNFNNIIEQDELNDLSSLNFNKNYGIFLIFMSNKYKLDFDSNIIKIIYKKKINNYMIYIINSYVQIKFKIKCLNKGFLKKDFYSINSYEFNPNENKFDFIINPKFENKNFQNNFNFTKYEEIKLLYNSINEIKDNDNKQLKDKLIINLLRFYVDKLDNKRLNLLEYFFLLII